MPTFAESLAAASKTLDSLLPAGAPEDKTVTVKEALGLIVAELAKQETSAARAEQLRGLLAEFSKNNYEMTSAVSLKVLNDPTQLQPKTESVGTVQTLASAGPDGNSFASNLKQALTKAFTRVEKATASDKLDEIAAMFGLEMKDFDEPWELSCKVGDVVRFLYQLSQVEGLGVDLAKAASPERKAWPNDMAGATFDSEAKTYKNKPSAWAREFG